VRLFLALLTLAACAARADDECPRKCDTQAAAAGATLVLDGNSGERLAGTARASAVEPLRIVVTTPNPFRYQYRVAISTAPLGPSLAAEFLGLIAPASPGAGAKQQPVTRDPCAGAPVVGPLAEEHLVVESAAQRLAAHLLEARALQEATAGESVEASCVAVCQAAGRVVAGDVDLPALDAAVAAARSKVAAALAGLPPDDACAQAAHGQEKKLDERVAALRQDAASDDALVARTRAAFSSKWLLARVFTPTAPEEPYGVKVALFRQDLRVAGAKEEAVGKDELTIGRRVLSLSGGVVVSWLRDQKVVRQPAASGTGSVFGYERASTYRPSVLLALNGAFLEWTMLGGRCALAATTGVVLSDPANPEYLLGLSMGFGDQAWFLTAGAHLAKVEELARNFKPGDAVPTGLADPLPLERRWSAGLGLGLTYRLR
jgi:hypothetical protein